MSWPARTICGVLEDMRKCYQTYNFQAIGSLIEECQMLANRMEAVIETEQTYESRREKLRGVNDEIKETKETLTMLKNELKLLTKVKEIK